MYTSYQIKLHNKALAILDMITQNNNRLSVLESNLHICQHGHKDSPIRLFQRPKDIMVDIEERKKIGDRIINYYLNTLKQINDSVFKQLSYYHEKQSS